MFKERSFVRPVVAALLVTLLQACGAASSTSSVQGDDAATTPDLPLEKPVLVLMGGFNSCSSGPTPDGQGLDTASRDLEAAIDAKIADNIRRVYGPNEPVESATRPRWFMSCFDKWGNIYYKSATVEGVKKTDLTNLDPLFDAILEQTGSFYAHPVYVIGHSHGGYLAMQTVLRLDAHAKIAALVTHDPISPNHCTPASYATAVALPATTLAGSLDGCQRAPSDVTADDRQKILDRLPEGHWKHYYQRNFLPLRSSAYEAPAPSFQADVSPFLSVTTGGAAPAINGHTGIHQLTSSWYATQVMVLQDLSKER